MHASFSSHQSNLQLAYTIQAWILNFKTCAMQANICNAHSNAKYKFMSLLPLLMCSNFNWSVYFVISPLCQSSLPLSDYFSPYHLYLCFSPRLSSMTIKVQILDRLWWNHVKWGSFSQIGSIKITCKIYLTRFDLRTSFFTPSNKGYLVPCWVKHL